MNWLPFSNSIILPDIVKSLILLAVVLTGRLVLMRAVTHSTSLGVETKRRWVLMIRNVIAAIFVIGLVFIWAHELSTFAVSLVAIAVALVLATKELILCLSGTVLRAGSNAYTLGDRIEISGTRGNVIDQNLLATTVLEIGPGHSSSQYTGRAVVFPNSLLLSHPVINETYMKEYVVQVLTVPLTMEEDWQAAEKLLLEIAMSECVPFMEEARVHMKQLEGKAWLDAPSVEPRVSLHLPEPGRIHLLLRIPSPAHRTSRLEQAILRRFLLAFTGKTRREERPI
jgi:small-conductance mechanosensitive channel